MLIYQRKICWLIVLALAFLLWGCGGEIESTAENEKITVVTSFYPMYVLTLNVTKNIPDVEVINMAESNVGCLHDYQITTSDMKILDSADVLVINGAGMESFLEDIDTIIPGLSIIVASEGLPLLEDTHNMHLEDNEYNSHIWVSPKGAAGEVINIAEGLSEIDPKHAQLFLQNGKEYAEKLYDLSTEINTKLSDIKNRKMITFHEAFPYFAKEFGFDILAVVENEPGQEPSAKEMDELIQIVNKEKIPALFVESQYPASAAQVISSETGATVYELDLVVTGNLKLSDEEVRSAYENAMRKNAETILEALQ